MERNPPAGENSIRMTGQSCRTHLILSHIKTQAILGSMSKSEVLTQGADKPVCGHLSPFWEVLPVLTTGWVAMAFSPHSGIRPRTWGLQKGLGNQGFLRVAVSTEAVHRL